MGENSEYEQDRLNALKEAEIENPEWFAPGSFGCHEVLHTASIMMETVSSHLADHPAILLDPEFYSLARDAHTALFDLYQAIGAKHLADED